MSNLIGSLDIEIWGLEFEISDYLNTRDSISKDYLSIGYSTVKFHKRWMKKRIDRYQPDEIRDAYLFLLPMLLFAVVFILLPVLGTLVTSLFREVTFLPSRFSGLDNYLRLTTDRHFWQSVRFTLLFVGVSVAAELVFRRSFKLLQMKKSNIFVAQFLATI